jgi:hypothetical protein
MEDDSSFSSVGE